MSARLRDPTSGLAARLRGIASTRVAIATHSGSRRATNRTKGRRADKRMVRERTAWPCWCSRSSRNRRTRGASRSVTPRAEGSIPTVSLIQVSHRRKVSRQLAIVWGLTCALLAHMCREHGLDVGCDVCARRGGRCHGVSPGAASALEPNRGGGQEGGGRGQRPVACLGAHRAQRARAVGQQGLHVGFLVIPATETRNGQGVPEGMRAGATPPSGGPEAKLTGRGGEGEERGRGGGGEGEGGGGGRVRGRLDQVGTRVRVKR